MNLIEKNIRFVFEYYKTINQVAIFSMSLQRNESYKLPILVRRDQIGGLLYSTSPTQSFFYYFEDTRLMYYPPEQNSDRIPMPSPKSFYVELTHYLNHERHEKTTI